MNRRHALAALLLCACGSPASGVDPGPDVEVTATREQLLDPEYCRSCHAAHYAEWSASMHAYAARDPVFLAMNRRGQRETGGALGDFCVRCHAPMAVLEGQTHDGLNLEELDEKYRRGVTCYFCHNAAAVEGTHNNPIRLSRDLVMRGGIADPLPHRGHRSEFSPLLAGNARESASLCGACHDVVLPSPPSPAPPSGAPVHLERTFAEWEESLFPASLLQCNGCHMRPPARGASGPAAEAPGLPTKPRFLHDHGFPGVDVALDRFPDGGAADDEALFERSRRAVQSFLDYTVRVARLCVEHPEGDDGHLRILVDLDNSAGHAWPTGAAHDRRAWVEVRALVDETEVFQSGALASDDEDVTRLDDPNLWLLRDRVTRADGEPAHMFWDVAASVPGTIPAATTRRVGEPGYDSEHAVREFPKRPGQWIAAPFSPERLRITARIRLQPIGFDVLDDLVASGDLEPAARRKMPIFSLYPNNNFGPELRQRYPETARFDAISFEWSAFTLTAGFNPSTGEQRLSNGHRQVCVGMSRPK